MSLTNSQHDAIMRLYDAIRTDNAHIQEQRYKKVTKACPEIIDIENEIITLSINSASDMILNQSYGPQDYHVKLEELTKRRNACLTALGLPLDYLDEIYTCPLCHDTGYVGQGRCSCFNKKAIDLVYSDSNLKNITDSENFNTFSYEWYSKSDIDPATGLTSYNNMQNVVSICHSFIDNFDKKFSNLLFYGNTGIGKTFLTNCIARELLNTSHSVIYLTAIELFKIFEDKDFSRNKYNNNEADSFLNQSYILDCDLLIIDDLGTESANSYTNSRLFYCINERILRQKSVIISTNFSLRELHDAYSERIVSRITSCYKLLKLFGTDIRLLKRTNMSK